MRAEGLILRSLSGFYEVRLPEGLVTCRARGLFRREGITPLVGDRAEVETAGDGEGTVVAISPRLNFLRRPPVANVGLLLVVVSTDSPRPNTLVIDRMTAIAASKGIETALVFTKTDLAPADGIAEIYRRAGFATAEVCSNTGAGVDAVRALLQGKINVFAGNTGAGKSSLLNCLLPGLGQPTGEISAKLGRGRHTTRRVELFGLGAGTYIADTPGFSTIEFEKSELILKEELPGAFREFAPYLTWCRFNGCTHVGEKGCAVQQAVEEGKIPLSRYESYTAFYREVKEIKEWDRTK